MLTQLDPPTIPSFTDQLLRDTAPVRSPDGRRNGVPRRVASADTRRPDDHRASERNNTARGGSRRSPLGASLEPRGQPKRRAGPPPGPPRSVVRRPGDPWEKRVEGPRPTPT